MSPIISIRDLDVDYKTVDRGRKGTIRVIHDMNLDVEKGETLAVVGESGSGKSTLALSIVGLVKPASGSITYSSPRSTESGGEIELVGVRGSARKQVQREIQLVFQNPLLSLSPRQRVGDSLDEPLAVHTSMGRSERRARIDDLIGRLELSPAVVDRFPHELSGGQAQRVVLARALALQPRVIVFDEPTSALDVSVQAGVLNLLRRLKTEQDLTYVFITHDLSVARHLADRIAVMQQGEIVELADSEALFNNSTHPYTQTLLASSLTI